MQQPMNTVIKHIEPMWGTPEKRKDFLGTMSILHLTGDRHSHIGASDTVQFHGDGGIALGPTDIAPRWVSQALKQAIVCYLELIDLAVKELKLMDVAAWNDVIDKATARASWLRREQVEGLHSDSPCPCGGGLPYGQCHEGVDLLPEELEPAK
jgi:hypothetical protein